MKLWKPFFSMALLALYVVGFSSRSVAHHSTVVFDANVTAVEGRVSEIRWQNPHVYIFVETSAEDGEVQVWRFESVPTPIMTRQGWFEDSLNVGDLITVQGYSVKTSDAAYAWLGRVIKEDGTVLDPGPIGLPPGAVYEGE